MYGVVQVPAVQVVPMQHGSVAHDWPKSAQE
jgi:hypothetical protein